MKYESTIESSAESPEAKTRRLRARRKRLFMMLAAAILVIAVLWLIYWLLIGSHKVTTDDAYVGADSAQVTAQVAGPIVAVPARETQFVHKGDVLAVIEPADYRLALEKARAELGQAERRVQG
jgi:membrane fusion protein (multidrug efflux system)